MSSKKFSVQTSGSPKKPSVAIKPPVVAVLGHVDHGKTTLLDAIRKTDLAAQEYGGITQHIGAYQVSLPLTSDQGGESKITFIDTPGHAAFTKMRARGAQVTDLALLVIAADDGVMPQTLEAIDHIRAAKVPLTVVVNKIDLPGASPAKIYQELAKHDVIVEAYGGKIPAVEVSATQKKGLDDLLEMILLVAGLEELKANPDGQFIGVVIESRLDPKRGPAGTILVRDGTLRVGNVIYAGSAQARVRLMINAAGARVQEAGPSTPVQVFGFNQIPEVGQTVSSESLPSPSLPSLPQQPVRSKDNEFLLILRADVEGTKEAILDALNSMSSNQAPIKILASGIGEVTESDIFLAKASTAVVIGFNVKVAPSVRKLAEIEGVVIKNYRVIYELVEELKQALLGFGGPKTQTLGIGEILKTFQGTKAVIAGVRVKEGALTAGDPVRVRRGDETIGQARIATMHQLKKNVKRTEVGGECGLTLNKTVAFQVGDSIESYRDIKEGI